MMTWDEDALEYGYVVERPPAGGWWHLHFGRAAAEYECALLGRATNILGCVQLFSRGAVRQSAQYLLTLDGEGIEHPAGDLRLDYSWGRDANDAELSAEARHFQHEVMPLLYESEAMQRAVAEIVHRRQHLRLIAPGRLRGA
jgi:hypothetical protein